MNKENTKYLKPTSEPIELEGQMTYNIDRRAWSDIRLKKEVISQFPQLRERNKKFGYSLMVCKEFKELEKQVKKIKIEKGVTPLLIWFVRE